MAFASMIGCASAHALKLTHQPYMNMHTLSFSLSISLSHFQWWCDEWHCITPMSMWIVTLNGDNNGLSVSVFYMRYLDDIHKMLLLYKFQWCFSVCLFYAFGSCVFFFPSTVVRNGSLSIWETYIDMPLIVAKISRFFRTHMRGMRGLERQIDREKRAIWLERYF